MVVTLRNIDIIIGNIDELLILTDIYKCKDTII